MFTVILAKVIFRATLAGLVVLIRVTLGARIGDVVLEGRLVRWRSSWGRTGAVPLSVRSAISRRRGVLALPSWRVILVHVFSRRIRAVGSMGRMVIAFGRRRICSGVMRRIGTVSRRRRRPVGRLLLSGRDVTVHW